MSEKGATATANVRTQKKLYITDVTLPDGTPPVRHHDPMEAPVAAANRAAPTPV